MKDRKERMEIVERINMINKNPELIDGFSHCELIEVQGVKRIRYVFNDYTDANLFENDMNNKQIKDYIYEIDKNDKLTVIEIDLI